MGQAKQRGSFETRKAQAEVRDAQVKEERRQQRLAIEAAKTPEQREKERRAARTFAAAAYPIAAWLGSISGGRR